MEEELNKAAQIVKSNSGKSASSVWNICMAEVKELQSENESLKSKAAQRGTWRCHGSGRRSKRCETACGSRLDGVDMNGLRDLGDQLKEKIGEGVDRTCLRKRWTR